MYTMIEEHAGKLVVSRAYELLIVRRRGIYEQRHNDDSKREEMDQILQAKIQNIFFENHRIYEVRKIRMLIRGGGTYITCRCARRLMEKAGLTPAAHRRYRGTTSSKHGYPVFPNLFSGDFTAFAANRIWVTDLTYILTDEGWLYLCTIFGIYSWHVVG